MVPLVLCLSLAVVHHIFSAAGQSRASSINAAEHVLCVSKIAPAPLFFELLGGKSTDFNISGIRHLEELDTGKLFSRLMCKLLQRHFGNGNYC